MRKYNELKYAKLSFKPLISKHVKLYFDKTVFEQKNIKSRLTQESGIIL